MLSLRKHLWIVIEEHTASLIYSPWVLLGQVWIAASVLLIATCCSSSSPCWFLFSFQKRLSSSSQSEMTHDMSSQVKVRYLSKANQYACSDGVSLRRAVVLVRSVYSYALLMHTQTSNSEEKDRHWEQEDKTSFSVDELFSGDQWSSIDHIRDWSLHFLGDIRCWSG